MKQILITNDDGFDSVALEALAQSLCDVGRVVVVAPASEKSACGHGLTLTNPLKLIKIKDDFYKLENGTPSDCVYLALNTTFESTKPDIVISGINMGANMGEDVTYSGTVAGAMEGALREIPSIAVSQVLSDKNRANDFDYTLATEIARDLVQNILDSSFPLKGRKLLNVNIPNVKKSAHKGIKITQLGYRLYGNDAHLRRDPRGQEYYWLGLHPLAWNERAQGISDFKAVFEGYTSITPIMLDLTSYEDMEILHKWLR